MSLLDLQGDFCRYLRSDGAMALDRVAPAAQRGLKVYHYAHRATLTAALRDVFERTHAWLGDDRFDDAVRTHIGGHAPSSWTLADYGLGFDRTLAMLYPDSPEVSELAWLDWSLRSAFNGPDSPPLDRAALGEVDWDTARLVLAPTLVWQKVRTNVATLWHALADGDAAPPAAEVLAVPLVLTVWRDGLMPRFQTVTRPEHSALMLAMNGVPFGEICETLAARQPDPEEVASQAGAMLGRWIAEGVLTAIG